jgi:hypothetical protein
MKVRVSLIGLVAVALALALLGVLNSARPTNALLPQPIQPFGPDDRGGISTTQLGQPLINHTVTDIIQGQRVGLPWIYSGGGGWVANTDAAIPDGTAVGTVQSSIDALCDGGVDVLAVSCSPLTPYTWFERTTAVGATSEAYLLNMVPPFPWLVRHRADITNLCLFGTVGNPTLNVLNTVYTSVPFSPGAKTFVATTKLGGSPAYPQPASAVCLDSPQSSNSITGVVGTPIYSTGPLAGADANTDGLDDNSGLYPRWTAFQNANALGQGDSRKPFASPPSIASDTNYIERTIDLQCYWLDDDGTADTADPNSIGYITSEESLLDTDMPVGIDADGDCLANAADAQPGQPTDAVDTPTGTLCPVLPYSEQPNLIQHDTAADRDCDGLVDGVEVAWGSNPTLADTDGDGATDFVEMFQFTDPTVQDSDGDGVKDKPEDDYIAAAAGAAESGEAVNADDNCPSVANADQANNDGKRRDNGSVVPGSWASNPMGDKMGDACDTDDDNDMAVDVAELAREDPPGTPDATNPLVADSDGDRCLDGVEGYLGKDPTDATSKCPAALTSNPLKFFRACRWNVPPDGYDSGLWDAEYDGNNDQAEFDPDGDGLVCQTGTSITDTDNDDGIGSGSLAPVEIVDNVEIMGYGTMAANKDSDGDGCQDWIEIVDVNGNRSAELLDVLFVAKRALGVDPNPGSDVVLDVDKNGSVTILDALVAAKNSSLVKSHSPCASEG